MGGDGGDPDREAILKRRRAFVAMALSGLTTIGCGDDGLPQACLSPPPIDPPAELTPVPPTAPLEPMQPTQPEPVAADPPSEDPEPAPEPVMRRDMAPPRACLRALPPRMAPPRTCLLILPDEASAPAPRPCLDYASRDESDDDDLV